ncbi:hypothetical protein ACJA28_00820 [Mesomycoplasma moatsii]|uniref:hypothetical protein n=1 Tax=Mesomycoplasma moatsii TaxID=171287 RepID=UPI0003B43FA3
MSLIDDENFNKKNNEIKNIENLSCKECNKEISNNSPILLCEDCFNKSVLDILNKIKNNLGQIEEEIKKIENTIFKIKEDLNKKNLHIIVTNKLEIDLMNFEAIKKKLIIDKELNELAFKVNQIQANKLRQELNWTLFSLVEIN